MSIETLFTSESISPDFYGWLNDDRSINGIGLFKSGEPVYKDLNMIKKFINNLSDEDLETIIKEIKIRTKIVDDWSIQTINFILNTKEYNIVVAGKGFKVPHEN